YGNLLVVDHGSGYHTLVAHLAELLPKVGDAVAVGERIGRVGDTGSLKGAYLYFELRRQGEALDPSLWFRPVAEAIAQPCRRSGRWALRCQQGGRCRERSRSGSKRHPRLASGPGRPL